MKRFATALLAGSALIAAAAPALAQPGYGGGYGGYGAGGYYNRLERLEDRIERGSARGDITRREAFRLRSDLREVRILLNRYERGGLSGWERSDLERRLDYLQTRIRYERRDGEDRGDWRRDRRGY